MREIKHIVIHCTATSQNTTIDSIIKYWKTKWKKPGYHYIITPEGEIRNLLSIKEISNGVKGYNENSIHIAYIGGIGADGKAIDNRTQQQKQWLYKIIQTLKEQFPNAEIKGHRDFENVNKTCPSFNVKQWVECTGL